MIWIHKLHICMGQLRASLLIAASVLSYCRICAQTSPVQPSASSESLKKSSQSAPVLKVTTRLVAVDVVANDGHGHPITDLKPQDFTVLEDGKPQQIRVFNFHGSALNGAANTALKTVRLPPNVYSNVPAYNPHNSLNIIVLDLINTDFEDQAYGRRQILKYLETIPEGEPSTLAVYTLGKKLNLVQDFTSDFAALKKSIQALKNQRYSDRDNLAKGISPDVKDLVPAPPSPVKEFSKVYEGVQQLDRRVEYTLEALYSLARNLSGYPGRKNLIWVSTTFPIGFGPDVELGPNAFDNLRSYEQDIIAVSQALADAEIAVYPVDPRGPLSPSMYSGHGTAPTQGVVALSHESESGVAEQNTMQQMADLTGGKAFYNQNDIKDAIRNSIGDGSIYYTLAYYPDNRNWTGEFRKITVRVDRPGLKLRHRPGYYALNATATQTTEHIFSVFGRALKPDSPVATGLRFEVGVVQPSENTKNKLLLNFALDPRTVSFEMEDDGLQHAAIDCAVQAYGDKGQLIKMDANTLSVALDPDSFNKVLQNYLLAHVSIELAPGHYSLRVGIMDEHTGLIGTADAKVMVAAPQALDPQQAEPQKH